jgi:hypothetical protein
MHAAWDEFRSPSTAPTCDNFFIFILAVIAKIVTLGFAKLFKRRRKRRFRQVACLREEENAMLHSFARVERSLCNAAR